MKTIKTGIICLAGIVACLSALAQTPPVREPDYNKPLLFQQLPQQMICNMQNLLNLFESETGTGSAVNFNIAENFNFRGIVTSTAIKDNGKISSVVIRSSNYEGAVLSFSRLIREDGTISFTGRIISLQHGDGFEIIHVNGNYILNKKGFYDMINE